MGDKNIAEIVLEPATPTLTLTAQSKKQEDKYQIILDAKNKLSTESIPKGTIQKKEKKVLVTADENITNQVESTKTEITKDKILLQIGDAKIEMKSDEIAISLGDIAIKLSKAGIDIKGDKITMNGQKVTMKAKSIQGKATQTNFGP